MLGLYIQAAGGLRNVRCSAESLDFRLVFGGSFGAATADYERFRGRQARREGFADLRRPHESFWACLETRFGPFRQKCEGFKEICDFAFKKFDTQGLDFLYGYFLIQVRPVPRRGCDAHLAGRNLGVEH